MNAGLDAGPNQIFCDAGSVLGPDFGEILTSLLGMLLHCCDKRIRCVIMTVKVVSAGVEFFFFIYSWWCSCRIGVATP